MSKLMKIIDFDKNTRCKIRPYDIGLRFAIQVKMKHWLWGNQWIDKRISYVAIKEKRPVLKSYTGIPMPIPSIAFGYNQQFTIHYKDEFCIETKAKDMYDDFCLSTVDPFLSLKALSNE